MDLQCPLIPRLARDTAGISSECPVSWEAPVRRQAGAVAHTARSSLWENCSDKSLPLNSSFPRLLKSRREKKKKQGKTFRMRAAGHSSQATSPQVQGQEWGGRFITIRKGVAPGGDAGICQKPL